MRLLRMVRPVAVPSPLRSNSKTEKGRRSSGSWLVFAFTITNWPGAVAAAIAGAASDSRLKSADSGRLASTCAATSSAMDVSIPGPSLISGHPGHDIQRRDRRTHRAKPVFSAGSASSALIVAGADCASVSGRSHSKRTDGLDPFAVDAHEPGAGAPVTVPAVGPEADVGAPDDRSRLAPRLC